MVHDFKYKYEAGVVVDGLVTENDVHTVEEIPEIVLGHRHLTAVVLWVVLLEDSDFPVHEVIQGLVQTDILFLYLLC